ncbi:MAG: KGGVGR-motif variant AAA ATPase, partial [Alphaproteobacteria bacterium]
DSVLQGVTPFDLPGVKDVHVVDRLATEGDWASISEPATSVPRIVFFSIKGGVGRSTALAVAAWSLAQQGKRVLVLDLDLESPGLSSSLLPNDRQPTHGIVDWLVEDLVDNGGAVFNAMVATSTLSRDGEIFVVPAHGLDPGEYVSKLGRAWMPKVSAEGSKENWSRRLNRLVDELSALYRPDVILIDSRAGIDEVASACVTDLSASAVLMFALNGEQTWAGYRMLFRHWRTSGVATRIRERLQLVGAMVPELGAQEYFATIRERAWDLFSEELYDEVPPGEMAVGNTWSFDEHNESAPHYPWAIHWHRGYAALTSLHERFGDLDAEQVKQVFGSFLDGIDHLSLLEGDEA